MHQSPGRDWVELHFPQLEAIAPDEENTMRFDAEDFETGRRVVLHLVAKPSETAWRRRLRTRLEQRAQIHHPRLSTILDHGEIGAHFYMIEWRPDGATLRQVIKLAGISRKEMLAVYHRIEQLLVEMRESGIRHAFDADSVYLSSQQQVCLAGLGLFESAARGAKWLEDHPAVGLRIGPYRLEQQLGEGGFGEVYQAYQEKPIARKVALKILRLGMDTREVMARFHRERQALAAMKHQGIAQVFDAGVTESGRPYIVMELIEGEPLTHFVNAHRLTLRQRARLMASIAHAIDHAHGKGIIHRDLKPSNILVELEGDLAKPKIIDFGIAQVFEEAVSGETVVTRSRQFLGSPAYMSPEQLNGDRTLHPPSDIYALGCVLYELLTGQPPRPQLLDPDTPLRVLLTVIESKQAEHPVDRILSLSEEEKVRLANASNETPSSLQTSLRSGLADITLKALAQAPEARYATAGAMASELERWIACRPIDAPRRPIAFTRKLQAGLGCVGLIAALLVISKPLLTSSLDANSLDPPPVEWGFYGEPHIGRIITNTQGIELVGIEPGQFLMGSPEEEFGRDPDEKQHPVHLRQAFYMGRHEITVEQFLVYLNDVDTKTAADSVSIWGKEGGPSDYRHQIKEHPDKGYVHRPGTGETWGDPSYPMIRVHYIGARHYCRWLTRREKDRLPQGYVYDLPSEAQWEYACRAGSATAYASGTEFDPCRSPMAPATSLRSVHADSGNAWGVVGMHGNASEWVYDHYDPNFYQSQHLAIDPINSASTDQYESHVVRGGSWRAEARLCRSANRMAHSRARTARHIGFRIALVPMARRSDAPVWLREDYPSKQEDLPPGVAQVMIMLAKGSQWEKGRQLEARLRAQGHQILQLKSVESLQQVPTKTEVRYLHHPNDEALAKTIANTAKSVGVPVEEVRFVDGFQTIDPPQTIEIWFSGATGE